MLLRRLIARLLAIAVIAGLSLAPLATPAAAQALAVSDMAGMSADMPCCPDEQNSKDCRDCPLIAMCVVKTVQAGPSLVAAMPVRHPIRTAHSVRNDTLADGLDRPPPDHPPRNLA
jgi:hypothetical protein